VLDQAWVGVDVGKEHHWVVAEDSEGRVVLSRKVANDYQQIVQALQDAAALARFLVWTVDLTTVEAALLLAVLWDSGQRVQYLSGRAVNHAAAGYRGEGKTDARDAHIIADQARMRRDLPALRPGDGLVVELRMLTARRADLVADRTRTLNRLRQQLTAICPALERAAEVTASAAGWCCWPATSGQQRSVAPGWPAWPPGWSPTACVPAPPKPSPRPRWPRSAASRWPCPARLSPATWSPSSPARCGTWTRASPRSMPTSSSGLAATGWPG
jgi:hypothetical protein